MPTIGTRKRDIYKQRICKRLQFVGDDSDKRRQLTLLSKRPDTSRDRIRKRHALRHLHKRLHFDIADKPLF
jgi:hypothetical protein